MNNKKLLIYEFNELVKILAEIKDQIDYDIIEFNQSNLLSKELFNDNNYLIITKNKLSNYKNQLILKSLPIKLIKLIEKLNIAFLKLKYNQQSEIYIRNYKINLNSREMFFKKTKLKLTEKETNIIIYLFNSDKPVKIDILQSEVWGYQSKLETHTVETHIYRLRKKILDTFSDNEFIISKKNGYQIK